MVQGKPSLVLGPDRTVQVPARAKSGAFFGAKDGSGPDFASFLSKEGPPPAAGSPPSSGEAERAGLPGRGLVLSMVQAAQSFFAQGNSSPAVGGRLSGRPEGTPAAEGLPEGVLRSAAPFPPGGGAGASRPGTASAALRAGSAARRADISPLRIGQEGRTRISGRPLAQRGGIGMEDTRKAREAKPKEGVSDVLSRGASSVPEERKAGGSWMDFSFRQSYTLQPSGVGAPGGFVREGSAGERGRTFAPPADSPPGGSGTAPRLPAREEGAAGRTASRREASRESSQASAGSSLIRTVRRMGAGIREDLGNLAAKFESGEEGIAAIGYDRHGGTSYGKFQIASRVGTMGKFLRYLEDKAPDLATRLASSGPANTGGRAGKMPEAWKGIAAEDPQRFERLQNDFIRESHFQPAVQQLAENTGVFVETMPAALQEVVFSTAVQHGPSGAFRIISRALGQVGEGRFSTAQKSPERLKQAGEELIRRIYALRAGQFASSTRQVQAAARERLRLEMRDALALLT